MKEFKKISHLINSYRKEMEEKLKNKKEVLSIFDMWDDIIGDEKLASHCRFENIENGNAVIYTSHAGWSQQILMRKNKILYNLKKKYPSLEIKNINIIIETNFKDKREAIKEDILFEKKIFIDNKNDIEVKSEIPEELKIALNKLKKAISSKNI